MAKRTLLIAIALLAVTGCRQMPENEWSRLQALRKEIRQEGLGAYAPDRYQEFETGFERIRFEYALQTNKTRLFRDTEQLKAQIAEEQTRGQAIRDAARQEKDRLKQVSRQGLDQLERSLIERSAGTLDPRQRRMITRAQLDVRQARILWEQGDYLRVREQIQRIEEQDTALEEHVAALKQRYRDPDTRAQWQLWVRRTLRWSREQGKAALVVDKLNRRALLYQSGILQAESSVDLGWNRLPDKIQQGDGATPEGLYRVVKKKGAGQTAYFRALLLDYPNPADRRGFGRAKRRGQVDPEAEMGASIEVHGEGGKGRDWTQGCVALPNADMQKVYDMAYIGMPVTIVGEVTQ
jgi:hypothetical protein